MAAVRVRRKIRRLDTRVAGDGHQPGAAHRQHPERPQNLDQAVDLGSDAGGLDDEAVGLDVPLQGLGVRACYKLFISRNS